MTTDLEDKIKLFERDYAGSQEIRELANEDMRFIMVAGGMWEGFLEDSYGAKPKMEYDMISDAVDRFMGEWENNELMPKFKAEDNSDDKDAEFIDKVFRGSWRKNSGEDAAKNAVFEAIVTGFGAMALNTKYYDEYDPEDGRQDVDFEPVFGAYSSVVFDSDALKIDKSDARHVALIKEYSRERFEELWPDHTPSMSFKDDRREFNWTNRNSVTVVKFYEVIEKKVLVSVFVNKEGNKVFAEDKDIPDVMEELKRIGGYRKVAQRKILKRHIERSVFTRTGYLEEPRKIVGKILPVIPFYAKRSIVDGIEIFFGLVRKQKDPSRVINLQISNLTEQASGSSKEVPMFAPQQVKGLEQRWSEQHLGKKNYALIRPLVDKDGNVISTGPVGKLTPPNIDPATAGLIEISKDHIRTTTGGAAQDMVNQDASGKAIIALQKRIDTQTYHIMGNIKPAMARVGEWFVSVGKEIFNDVRKVAGVARNGAESSIVLNEVKKTDSGLIVKNSFKKGNFSVYGDAGPSYQSQRRESMEFLKELIQILPEGDPRIDLVLSAIIDNMEGVGLDVVKEMNRKRMLLNGYVQPDEDNPEEIQMVQDAANQAEEPDAAQELMMSQTALNLADAKGKEVENFRKIADAEKKKAETQEILQSIGIDKIKSFLQLTEARQNLPA